MANNYCESSSMLKLHDDQKEQAAVIIDRICDELENGEDGYVGFNATIEKNGVWIRHDESLTPEHVAILAKALMDELDIEGVFVFSWSYACDKPRIDEFGGGACAIKKGHEPYWVDAHELAITHF